MSEGLDPELQALTTVEEAWGPGKSRGEGSGNSFLAQLRHMKRKTLHCWASPPHHHLPASHPAPPSSQADVRKGSAAAVYRSMAWVRSLAPELLNCAPQASDLTSPSLSFPVCKMGTNLTELI